MNCCSYAWPILLVAAAASGGTRRFTPPEVTLPPMAQAPTVDGAIGEDEWAGAARWVGVIDIGGSALAHRRAVLWLGSDGKRVYLAIKSETPPDRKLVATHKPVAGDKDTKAFWDDSVEVWLDPYKLASPARGLYQGVFNLLGAIYDANHQPPANWRGDWKLASTIAKGWWHFEGSVSLASLGATAPLGGQTWGLRLVRNWKAPWKQSPLTPLASHFSDRGSMAVVHWQDTAPVVQMVRHRSPDGTKAQYVLRIRNPHTTPVAVHVRIDHQPSDSQHAYIDRTHTVAGGQVREVSLDQATAHPDETIYTRLHAASPDGRTVYFHREYTWKLARPEKVWGEVAETLGPLAKVKKALLFHASFDKGTDADVAAGDKTGRVVTGKGGRLQRVEGVAGKALLSGSGGAAVMFATAKNIDVRQGTVSFWIRPVRWLGQDQGDKSHSFFQTGRKRNGYFGLQMARFNSDTAYLQWYMIQYTWRNGAAMSYKADVPTWKPDQWHWIVMTWTPDEVTWYVDGRQVGRKGIDPALSERDLTRPHFMVGKGSGQHDQTAIDEVKIFGRALSESEVRQAKLFCRSSAGAAAWEAVQLDFGHYPYYRKLKARVDINALKGKEHVRGATLVLRRVGGKQALATIQMPPLVNGVSEIIADVPALTDGQYQVALRLDGAPKALEGELVREFPRKTFAWEHNTIGTSDRILPPFTPIRVTGRTVSTILRDHTMSDQGLWEQVVAKGEPILADRMRLEFAVRKGVVNPRHTLRFIKQTDTRVTTEATWRVADTDVRVTSTIDYDGMMWCEVNLAGGRIEHLDLTIPVKDAMAPLAHICGERLRANFAGYVPKGDGVVWDASKTMKHDLVTPFCPYVWVGGEERGICWFAETDRDWTVDDKTPCQQLVRRNGVLTLCVRIFQKPTVLGNRPRRIAFGLQATPVKPMPVRPAHWRTWCNQKLPGAMQYTILGSTYYFGTTFHDPFPANRDLAFWKKLGEARRTGKGDFAFARKWVDTYPVGVFKGRAKKNYVAHVMGGTNTAAAQPQRLLVYVQGRGTTFRTPEFQTFQDEWTHTDYNSRVWRTGYQAGLSYTVEPVPSWQDFTLWWLKKQMETFTDGLYFDNFFMIPVSDRVISQAYRRVDGRIQPAVPIRNMRRMMRRTAVMYLEADRHPMIGPHMTNTAIVPMMSFGQFGLDWEWHYGRSDYQDRWTRDHIRAACLGRQTGCAPLVISIGSKGASADEVEWLNRSFNGVALTHELIPCWYSVNRFIKPAQRKLGRSSRGLYYRTIGALLAAGYGTPACRTHNYWDADYPLKVTGTPSSSIVHRAKDRTFVIVTDWATGGPVRATLDLARLGLAPGFRATDLETGQPVTATGATLTFPLKKHDYRVVLIR